MTRFGIYSALAVTTLTMLGCGGASTPPPQPAATPAAPVAQQSPSANKKRITIIMTQAPIPSPMDLAASCAGTAVGGWPPKVKRQQVITWVVTNDTEEPCVGLDESKVTVEFINAIWVDNNELNNPGLPTLPPVKILSQNRGMNQIVGEVFFDSIAVPDGRYKYVVKYFGLNASPDPDVDVDGDCGGGCAP